MPRTRATPADLTLRCLAAPAGGWVVSTGSFQRSAANRAQLRIALDAAAKHRREEERRRLLSAASPETRIRPASKAAHRELRGVLRKVMP